ncbi:pyrimidine operon attenuation protein / uracil phosphoribosyltransferase [Marivirga sericea]|uniref:Pyrimidine operon attenuation protein / uracil phosphoribosyltransferase n=1 Tax=Marivirga sericea TaxID=1028 RepID=A0A1X7IRK9_9BACT|nr:bifunctional pyr operon transcriptional regulator/uracil phosphoribosyltransferase PyrR [Marivirga sericea]SMG17478.1 pyrimidine operon attenuation protein / uracil phosphoribosyltransferase [Marivirga sericea]
MEKRLILDTDLVQITINRLVEELIENHKDFQETVLIGLQPRGIFLAQRIQTRLNQRLNKDLPLGLLDTTFYRDDFRRRDTPLKANATKIPFIIEDKKVVLIDDVLFTGRTVRAALDAMIAFGRPKLVELLTFIDRKYTRDLPIQPDYVGRRVNTIKTQRVLVEWTDQGAENDKIWLVTNEEK